MGGNRSALRSAMLRFIRDSLEKHGRPPSLREIGEEFGIHSTNGVRYHLSILESEGFIHRQGKVSRGIQLTDRGFRIGREAGQVRLPVLGRVAAGRPLFAEENVEDILELDARVAGSGSFGLRVRGDSMKDAGILEGDVAIVQPRKTARSGDIIVALLGDDATVKRYVPCKDRVILRAENPKYNDIIIDSNSIDFKIVGRVIGIIRERV